MLFISIGLLIYLCGSITFSMNLTILLLVLILLFNIMKFMKDPNNFFVNLLLYRVLVKHRLSSSYFLSIFYSFSLFTIFNSFYFFLSMSSLYYFLSQMSPSCLSQSLSCTRDHTCPIIFSLTSHHNYPRPSLTR